MLILTRCCTHIQRAPRYICLLKIKNVMCYTYLIQIKIKIPYLSLLFVQTIGAARTHRRRARRSSLLRDHFRYDLFFPGRSQPPDAAASTQFADSRPVLLNSSADKQIK
ncbi:g5.5 [Tranosema rostrale ichnovirus]|nr:g5.5 [Tranosema rostrale ichnovirus]